MIKRKTCSITYLLLMMILPAYLVAAENEYSSVLVNKSKEFKLIKTRMWPKTGCLIDTGKPMVNPGESTVLKIKKDKLCNDSGVGYEIYRLKEPHKLLGYLSHRLGDGEFSLQISRFCMGDKCVFQDLNPEQSR